MIPAGPTTHIYRHCFIDGRTITLTVKLGPGDHVEMASDMKPIPAELHEEYNAWVLVVLVNDVWERMTLAQRLRMAQMGANMMNEGREK